MADSSNAVNDGFEVIKVQHDGALWLPKKYQKDYNVKDGDHFKIKAISPVKFILEKILILSVVAMLPMGFVMPLTFAQSANEQVAGVVNQINQEQGQPLQVFDPTNTSPNNPVAVGVPTITDGELVIPLAAESAKLPFRLEVTYPSGIETIQNLTRLSLASNYFFSEQVIEGLTVKSFTTGMADTWTITIGQKYSQNINQIARVLVFSNNSQVIPGMLIPINGNEFKVKFVVTTSHPTPIPTGEDIARPITSRLDQIYSEVVNHDDRTERTETTLGYAANSFRLTIVVWLGTTVIVAAGVVLMYVLYRRITSSAIGNPPPAPLKAQFTFGSKKGGDSKQ